MSDENVTTATSSQVVPEEEYIEINGWEFTEILLEQREVNWWLNQGVNLCESHGYAPGAYLYCLIVRDAVKQFRDEATKRYHPLGTILNQFGAEGWELVRLEMPPHSLDARASGSLRIGEEYGSVDFDVRSSDWPFREKLIAAIFKRPKTYYKLRPSLNFAGLRIE